MKKRYLFLLTLVLPFYLLGQSVGVGHWQAHLAYSNAVSVAQGNSKVYCATKSGVFVYNKSDNSIETLSKVNGLSDVEAVKVNVNKYNNKTLIAYVNSNIDIIDNTTIVNLADIKRKAITGNKSINNIYFIGQFAYLSCGFGIVVLDMDKYEIKDTYYIGNNGNPLNVRDVISDSTYLYAATDAGIYRALLNNPNLSNYTSWLKMPGLPKGIYNSIASLNGKIIVNFSKNLMDGSKGKDTLFVYNNIKWSYFSGGGNVVNSLHTSNQKLAITYDSAVALYDSNLVKTNQYAVYFNDLVRGKQTVIDNSNTIWIADALFGLVSIKNGNNFEFRYPNGPHSANVNSMCLENGNLWVAPGGGSGTFFNDGIYTYNSDDWVRIYGGYAPIVNFDSILNIMNVIVDNNTNKRYAVYGDGLIEFEDRVPVKIYNTNNSTLKKYNLNNSGTISLFGLAIDQSKNLWITNSGVPACLSKKASDGTWASYDFSSVVGQSPDLTQLLIDKSNQKWMILYRSGLMVYNETTGSPNNTNTKVLTIATGQGALPSLNVFCMAEDKDGQIWVGTDKGIGVFYSPSTLFLGQNYDAQQILLEQDGNIQPLLQTESVQSIAVDDANRKWIATKNSGVFLMSPDGTKEVYHFTESNSPLFSNDVKSIVINHKTGEIYFGTSKGILSFRGTATESFEDYTDVYAFPNPVKPTYDGPIAIKGLTNNSTVKITDISGALVYETKSEGGQAIWYGKNTSGAKVSTGVYMVFCTSEDGSKKIATKILFIN